MATAHILIVLSAGSIVSMFSVDVNVECVRVSVLGGGGGLVGRGLAKWWWNLVSGLAENLGNRQKNR